MILSIRYNSAVLLMWRHHKNCCLLDHPRNNVARGSTFICSSKPISSYYYIYIFFFYFSMTTSAYCFSKKDSIR